MTTSDSRKVAHTTETEEAESSDGAGSVLGIMMQKCQGNGLFSNSLPWATPLKLQSVPIAPQPMAWPIPLAVVAGDCDRDPPEPPPRLLTSL